MHDPRSVVGSLAPAVTAVRLSLHVLAAAVFVGGQFTIAGLVPTLRSLGDTAPRTVARQFGRLQWPAYFVLLATGVWNAIAVDPRTQGHAWNVVFVIKVVLALAAGAAAYLHQRARSKAGLAAFGGIAGLSSLAALVLGVVLAG